MQDSRETNVQGRFLQFLQEFTKGGQNPFIAQIKHMQDNDRTTLVLQYDHVNEAPGWQDLANILIDDFYQYEQSFRRAIQEFMFLQQQDPEDQQKLYFLAVDNLPGNEKIRDLKANKVGKLIQFMGTVTRVYEVRPELLTATFQCMMCDKIIEKVEQQFKFTEPKKCTNPKCDNKSKWQLKLNKSQFTDFQKIRVQEDAKEIPAGSMPRSIDVILHNDFCDVAKPGDKCRFIGYLTVIPDVYSVTKPGVKTTMSTQNLGNNMRGQAQDGITGLKQLGVKDLCYKFVFIAINIQVIDNSFDLVNQEQEYSYKWPNEQEAEDKNRHDQFQKHELAEIAEMCKTPDLYKNLAQSIAPAVSGYEEIKKGILLMLMGGVNKTTREGVNLRGDINVCIVGDPSTAKSQFLKFACNLQPRSVYTSGKASSAAGLTASVNRDIENGEFCIEAGALMLADHGICCIDEFDKMDQKDQVAIHEAMEQQTITLAKAGIHATLNARTSILAAANPIFGRYDKSKSLKFNVNMTQPIMSRFDLFFVITDQCKPFVDQQIATHIVRLHSQQEKAIEPKFTQDQLKRYIRYARFYKPRLTRESAEYLREAYIRLRENDSNQARGSYRITVRQLESLIRLSEAMARVYCDHEIRVSYVKEAEKLLSQSILTVEDKPIVIEEEDEDLNRGNQGQNQNIIQEELNLRERAERRQRNQIKLSNDEFYSISKNIITYLKQRELEQAEEVVEQQGVLQEELIHWYFDNILLDVQTEEQVYQYERLLLGVIQKLINKENVIIILKDDRDPNRRYLSLHPNVER